MNPSDDKKNDFGSSDSDSGQEVTRNEANADVDGLDLTPAAAKPTTSNGRWRNRAIVGCFLIAASFLLYQALVNARVYFLNVDEALAQKAELGTDTFQMQGTVVTEPVDTSSGATSFILSFDGAQAEVSHIGGEPSDLFELDSRVVAQGSWKGEVFESQRIVVKHSEEYVEDNRERVNYELDGTEKEIS